MSRLALLRLSAFLRDWRAFLIFIAVMFSFRSAIADWNDVPSGSMLPTILIGDRLLVDKLAYDLKFPFTTMHLAAWGDPQRGDIVVFYSPADGNRLVKRVIGLPGDEIAMLDNRLVINGEPLRYERRGVTWGEGPAHEALLERLGARPHLMLVTPQRPAFRSFAPVKVPPDAYLVMGDNRDNSNDSRFIGFIPRSEIVGRASRVVISLDPERWHLPRAERFLARLDAE